MTVLVSIAAVLVIVHYGWPLLVAAGVLVAVAAGRVWAWVRGPFATSALFFVGVVVASVAAFAVLVGTVIGLSAATLEVGKMYARTQQIEATLVDDH